MWFSVSLPPSSRKTNRLVCGLNLCLLNAINVMPFLKLSCLMFCSAHVTRFLINLYFKRKNSPTAFHPNWHVWFWSISRQRLRECNMRVVDKFLLYLSARGRVCECLLPYLFSIWVRYIISISLCFFFLFVLQTTVSSAFLFILLSLFVILL